MRNPLPYVGFGRGTRERRWSVIAYKVLGAGLDTFVFWLSWEGKYRLPEEFVKVLDEGLEWWRDGKDFVFNGIDLFLRVHNPHTARPYEVCEIRGRRHFRWLLLFQGGKISVALADPRKQGVLQTGQPQAYVEVSGSYMRDIGRDFRSLVHQVKRALSDLVGSEPVLLRITRADLFADVLSPHPLRLEHLPLFTSRSRARAAWVANLEGVEPPGWPPGDPSEGPPKGHTGAYTSSPDLDAQAYFTGPTWTGFRFGTGEIVARVYSKSYQARFNPEALATIQSYGNPDGEVIRVEFQLRAPALASMVTDEGLVDLRDFDVFESSLNSLWAYLTHSWLVLRSESGPARIRERPVHPLWLAVQSAFDSAPPVHRPPLPPRASLSELFAQGIGTFIRVFASLRLSPSKLLPRLRKLASEVRLSPREVRLLREKDFYRAYELALVRLTGGIDVVPA